MQENNTIIVQVNYFIFYFFQLRIRNEMWANEVMSCLLPWIFISDVVDKRLIDDYFVRANIYNK